MLAKTPPFYFTLSEYNLPNMPAPDWAAHCYSERHKIHMIENTVKELNAIFGL